VLIQIQGLLSKEGFYSGDANGSFSKETSEALVAYQTAKKLTPTGMPDQPTLGSLLGRKAAPKQ
jgi:peptidoglycan hydrolase-like protein with peptidoglycan-binding domain